MRVSTATRQRSVSDEPHLVWSERDSSSLSLATGYDEAKKIDGMPAPPMKSFASLEVELQSRLKEHEDAVKAARV